MKTKTEIRSKRQALVAWLIMRGLCVCHTGDTVVLFDPKSTRGSYYYVGSDGGLRVGPTEADSTPLTAHLITANTEDDELVEYLQEIFQLMS